MSYSAAAIGLAGLGLNSYIARKARQYQSKYPLPSPMPVSKPDVNAANIRRLYSIVNRNKPSWNYYENPVQTLSLPINSNASLNFSPTSTFIGDVTAYEKLILGDTYRNQQFVWRCDFTPIAGTAVKPQKVRILIYWARKAGNQFTATTFTPIPDPAAFQVLYDRTFDPEVHGDFVQGRLNLKGKITKYNQSSAVLESGQLWVHIQGQNASATAITVNFGSRLTVTNK